MARRRRRKKKSGFNDAISLITSIALLVIAVLMVIFVVFYIRNNSFFGLSGLNRHNSESMAESSEVSETESDAGNAEAIEDEKIGLCKLDNGEIVYIMDPEEAAEHEEGELIEAPSAASAVTETERAGKTTGDERLDSKVAAAAAASAQKAAKRYYLANSWLDLGSNLYYFGADGYACRDSFKEGAFIYEYDNEGILKEISYNKNYTETAQQSDFPGLVQTKTLWAFMDTKKTLGDYTAVMFKKTTDSLSHVLGGDSNPQYASKYAYDVVGGKILYLAVPQSSNVSDNASDASGSGSSGADAVLKNIVGKVFCMTPGADYREIAAEGAYGFKAFTNDADEIVVYYYDGTQVRRSTQLTKDESMVTFTEDASYTVDTSEGGRAYLTLSSGQRVTLKSGSFKAGNFTYSLAADGEILSVAEKTTVNTGGYTYSIENGEAFGSKMARVIRKDKSGTTEVISSEFSGSTGNLHFDYDSSSIIAEYVDGKGSGGLLKITLSGDIDLIQDSISPGGKAVLYAIDNGNAVYRTTEGGEAVFRKARISATTPLAVAIDPVKISGGDDTDTQESAANSSDGTSSGSASSGNVSSGGTSTVETGAAPAAAANTQGGTNASVGMAPGGGSQ